jgi:DNA-binding helix-turn-helix protein|nr:MAG TPA: helix-turn-helix domain protein [Caudoviricetes sp.]
MLKLKFFRIQKGLTIVELAKRTGLNYNTISQYESGKHKPRIDNLQKIAEALECEVKDIV